MAGLILEKYAEKPSISYGLKGRLFLAESGWLMLSVPNAVVRGLYDALEEPGAELWLKDGKLNAHISVMRDDEVSEIGADKITERGHTFSYTLGKLKKVNPDMPGYNAVWFVEVKSPELEQLRKSYGLSKRPKNNEYEFHITVARRKNSVLMPGTVSKAAMVQGMPFWQAALKRQLSRPTWNQNQGFMPNILNNLRQAQAWGQRQVSGNRSTLDLMQAFDPQFEFKRMAHLINKGDPVISNPVDKLLFR